MTEEKAGIDRDYLFKERRALLQRLAVVEDHLEIPRSVVPKRLRTAWRKFLKEKGLSIDGDIPNKNELNGLDITETGPE